MSLIEARNNLMNNISQGFKNISEVLDSLLESVESVNNEEIGIGQPLYMYGDLIQDVVNPEEKLCDFTTGIFDDEEVVELNDNEIKEEEKVEKVETIEEVISDFTGHKEERAILPHAEYISDKVAKYIYMPEGVIPEERSLDTKKRFNKTFQDKLIPYIVKLERKRGKRFIFKMESYIDNGSFRIRSFDFTTREFYPYDHEDCIVIKYSGGKAHVVNK